jgi:hypothetical protein
LNNKRVKNRDGDTLGAVSETFIKSCKWARLLLPKYFWFNKRKGRFEKVPSAYGWIVYYLEDKKRGEIVFTNKAWQDLIERYETIQQVSNQVPDEGSRFDFKLTKTVKWYDATNAGAKAIYERSNKTNFQSILARLRTRRMTRSSTETKGAL